MSLCVDAKSVYAAVTATFIKTPAEKSLLCHVQYLRELLDNGVLRCLMWLDTRVMGVDGLTKGAVSRDALQELMRGTMVIRHPSERWQCRKPGGAKVVEDISGSGNAEGDCLEARISGLILFCMSNTPLDQITPPPGCTSTPW